MADASRSNGVCKGCGRPIVWITTDDGKRVCLDPSAPIYVRASDGEGNHFWHRDKSVDVMVSHFSTCSHANDFSGRGRRGPACTS